jgi:diguanylate cyclase
MIDPRLWADLVGSLHSQARATPRDALDLDELLPPSLHPDDRAAAAAVVTVAAGRPGFRSTLVGRLHRAAEQLHVRMTITSDQLNVVIVLAPDRSLDDAPDAVTGLPGRAILLDRIDQALLAASRSGRHVAVLRVGLDRFLADAATHGSVVAEDLLRTAVRALERGLRPADTVARLDGDELVVVTPDLRIPADLAAVAERTRSAIEREVRSVDGAPVHASIGIGLGDASSTAQALLAEAGAALQRVRDAGGGRWMVGEGTDVGDDHLALGLLVRAALDDRTVDAWYQPVVGADGRTHGVEAVVAVLDAHGDPHPAEQVLTAAARGGLLARLDQRVLERVVEQVTAWHRSGITLVAGVNIDTGTVATMDVAAFVRTVLARENTPPGALRIELDAVHLTVPSVRRCVSELHALGVAVVAHGWDGDGHAVEHALAGGIREVKLARSLVAGLAEGIPAELRANADRLRAGGVELTAVGIETAEQAKAAAALGCTSAQGFLLGRPVPAARIPAMLRRP